MEADGRFYPDKSWLKDKLRYVNVCFTMLCFLSTKLTPLSRFSAFAFGAISHLNIICPFTVAVFPTTAHG